MRTLLDEIQDGSFAQRWVAECESGAAEFRTCASAQSTSNRNRRSRAATDDELAPGEPEDGGSRVRTGKSTGNRRLTR